MKWELIGNLAGRKGEDGKKGEDAQAVDLNNIVKLVLAEVPKPQDGKDADQEAIVKSVLREVTAAFDSIPVPKDGNDGKDGKDVDPQAIAKAIDPILDKVQELESRLKSLPVPKDGINGKDAAPVDVDALAARVFAQIRMPIDGKDGQKGGDGKDVDPREVRAAIADEVASAVAKIPKPADGKDFDPELIRLRAAEILPGMVDKAEAMLRERLDGWIKSIDLPKDGEDGTNGKDYDPTVLNAAVVLAVKSAVAEIPPASAGKDANEAAIASEVFDRVMKSIRIPADGKSVTIDEVKPLLEGEVSRWELEFERRAADLLQRAVDKLPRPKNGADGFSLDDIDLETREGGRFIAFKFKSGDREVVREVQTKATLDRGVWKSGEEYQAGDGVTYGGSFWFAQVATKESPSDSRDGVPWRMAIRRPKDGKDAGAV